MKTITLYRTAFRNDDEFETILFDLKIEKEKWEDIDEIDLFIEKSQCEWMNIKKEY